MITIPVPVDLCMDLLLCKKIALPNHRERLRATIEAHIKELEEKRMVMQLAFEMPPTTTPDATFRQIGETIEQHLSAPADETESAEPECIDPADVLCKVVVKSIPPAAATAAFKALTTIAGFEVIPAKDFVDTVRGQFDRNTQAYTGGEPMSADVRGLEVGRQLTYALVDAGCDAAYET